jgi:hypothetical protein
LYHVQNWVVLPTSSDFDRISEQRKAHAVEQAKLSALLSAPLPPVIPFASFNLT